MYIINSEKMRALFSNEANCYRFLSKMSYFELRVHVVFEPDGVIYLYFEFVFISWLASA